MRESSFIRQNKEKWEEFEGILENKYKDPDKLNDLFVQVTDDLSFSRTFYPNRSVRVYLNGLAQKVFFSIYRTKNSRRSRIFHFWLEELPKLVYEARREFRTAFLLFALAMAIGALSSAMEPEFLRTILGDSYVDMTLRNIESGDPMAVYKEKGAFGMSVGITANNIFVALLTFVSGVFYAIGTVGLLLQNGVMVGAFQYFFVQEGLFWESFLTIWLHGTLEISAIVIAGAAGLTMGRGLVFPGTLSRLKSFQQSARRGIKILMGTVPLFFIAGFIEGYLTRHTDAPDLLRGFFILCCLAFVLGYFVWYPVYKARRGFKDLAESNTLHADADQQIDISRIKSSGGLFADTFVWYRQQLSTILRNSALAAGAFCLLVFSLASPSPAELYPYPNELFGTLEVLPTFFLHERAAWLPLVHILLFAGLAYGLYQPLLKLPVPGQEEVTLQPRAVPLLKLAIGGALLTGILITMRWFTPLLLLLGFPLVLLWTFITLREDRNTVAGFGRFFFLLRGEFGRFFGLAIILAFLGLIFFLLLDTSIFWIILETITLNFSLEQGSLDNMLSILLTFTALFLLFLVFSAMLAGAGLLYFTLLEIKEAPHLVDRIRRIGLEQRIRGIVTEDTRYDQASA
ncbi:MAG: stage II sporulation protein M [Saprospiraceae bacterium]|nr:stage II sporulation protein M [Saprospiraceae bacterium]